jgi:hypothetical protein
MQPTLSKTTVGTQIYQQMALKSLRKSPQNVLMVRLLTRLLNVDAAMPVRDSLDS